METFTKGRAISWARYEPLSSWVLGACTKSLLLALLGGTIVLSACGSGSSGSGLQIPLTLSGNWQFTMAPPSDGSFLGGLQGGFLLQNNGSVTGGTTYAISLPNLLIPCNTGSAAITGTISGQNVQTLTAVAGTQTFMLTGTLSLDGSTMAGTYASTAGTAADGAPCGTAQTGLQWSAVLVPPLTGSIQGSFHSAGGAAGLGEQDFLVSGALTQAVNTGASNAAVTGNLNFVNTVTNVSDYPCFGLASLYGQISGNSVTLQMVGADGSEWGLIGEPIGSLGSTGVNPVTFNFVQGGYILQGAGPAYLVATTPCPGNLSSVTTAGDFGNICLALNSTTACQQPITLSPSALSFSAQVIGSTPTTQTITLANASGTDLAGVTLNLANNSGAANYTEMDACGVDGAPSQGQPFVLHSGQSCAITVTFAPLETCAVGTPPDQCPSPLTATLTIASPNDYVILKLSITGTGVSEAANATPQFNFGAEGALEAILPQLLSFAHPWRPQAIALQNVEHHAEID